MPYLLMRNRCDFGGEIKVAGFITLEAKAFILNVHFINQHRLKQKWCYCRRCMKP